MAMKKSHKWEVIPLFWIRCPHCGEWFNLEGDYDEGDNINCLWCLKDFELGQQRY